MECRARQSTPRPPRVKGTALCSCSSATPPRLGQEIFSAGGGRRVSGNRGRVAKEGVEALLKILLDRLNLLGLEIVAPAANLRSADLEGVGIALVARGHAAAGKPKGPFTLHLAHVVDGGEFYGFGNLLIGGRRADKVHHSPQLLTRIFTHILIAHQQ